MLIVGALSCLVALSALLPSSAKARAYTIDDLLKTEGFGQIAVAPGGRWLVFEQLLSSDGRPQIEENVASVARSRLYRVDLAMPGPAVPLVPIEERAGDTLLGFSPEGQRAAIGRLDGSRWRLGIVTLRTGAVRWLPIAPDFYPSRTTLGWLSEDALVVSARKDGSAPWLLGDNGQDEASSNAAWEKTRAGKEASVTAVGSGTYLPVTPLPPIMTLFEVDVTTGATAELAQGRFENLAVSPDGRHVALTELAEAIRIATPDPLRQATDVRRRRLVIVDVLDHRSWRPCPGCDLPFFPPIWSSSGDHLLFYSRDASIGWRDGEVVVVDVRHQRLSRPDVGGLRPAITTIQNLVDAPGLGWVGETPLFYARQAETTARADWYALDPAGPRKLTGKLAAPSWSPAALTGRALLQQQGSAWRLTEKGVMAAGPRFTTLMMQPVPIPGSGQSPRPHLFGWKALANGDLAVTADAARAGEVQVPRADGRRLSATSAKQRVVIATDSDDHGVIALEIWRKGRPPVIAATVNRHLADVEASAPIRIEHVLPDGTQATSWLYLPTERPTSAKPPLVVIEYPTRVFGDTAPYQYGPGYSGTYNNVPMMTGHGYAVLLPSMPRLPASSLHPFDFAGQILSAVDAAIATGRVDGHRLALWGHSYGGYAAAIAASETDRFAAVIAANGPSGLYDMATMFTAFSRLHPDIYQPMIGGAGWAERGQPDLGATPWSDPARYLVNNAVQRSAFIKTPMLIIASDRDIVPIGSSEALFSSLYRQGKDAILLTYWNEQHALSSPANVRDSYTRIFAWLDGHFTAVPMQIASGVAIGLRKSPVPANDAPIVP